MPGDKPNFIVTTPGKTIVTFKPDGRVELGEGISPSEAAKEMFAILEPMLRQGARPVSAGETEGWMDIASAPRDGSEMLLYAHLTDDQGSLTHCFGVGRWWNDDGGAFGWDFDSPPTHWRPLAPPLSAGGEG